ncbi:MAG: hypothetical protein ACLTHV_06215 [Parasutterella excrementihominis]
MKVQGVPNHVCCTPAMVDSVGKHHQAMEFSAFGLLHVLTTNAQKVIDTVNTDALLTADRQEQHWV